MEKPSIKAPAAIGSAAKKANGFIGEFRKFISKGNVMDMAVGIIIGSAFTAIVNSLVSDLLMPLLGMITGKVDFSQMKVILQAAVKEGETIITPEVSLNYGMFIQYIINFLLVAFSVFVLIKILGNIKTKAEKKLKKEEEAAAAAEPPKPDPQLELLTEIRDLLKQQK